MRKVVLSLLVTAAAALSASTATAEQIKLVQSSVLSRPLLSWDRLSMSAGVDYAFYNDPAATSARVPEFRKEWEVGIYGSYVIVERLHVAGSIAHGLDNKLLRSKLGLRLTLKN